jgi:glycosyltransferase involved in cell wall biosynthesis
VRILLSAYACDPGKGSEAGNGWNWAVHLAKNGHEVWVFTGNHRDDHPRRLRHSVGLRNLHILELPIPRWGSLFLHGIPGVYIHYLLWLRQSHKAARKLLALQSIDLVHHVTWGSLFFGSPLWRNGIPFVLGPVGGAQTPPRSLTRYLGDDQRREHLRSTAVRFGMRFNPLARQAARHASIVFATNSETAQVARGIGARSVHLLADTAVPPELLNRERRALQATETTTVLWIARLYPNKGLLLALDALSRIEPDVKWSCVIAGDGPQSGKVQAWIRKFGVSDRTRWIGEVSWQDIGRVYAQADVLLFTSLRDSSGAQLYEAAAHGLPIVALDHHGVTDLMPDGVAAKVPVGDPDETAQGLARALEALARDPMKRRVMSEAAFRFALDNTWEVRVKEAYEIIESSLADIATQ